MARRLHGGQVAEQVGGAVLGLQEPVALGRHERFDERTNPPAGCASAGLLSAGFGSDRPVAGRASERRRAGRSRGKIDGMDPGNLGPASARRYLAGDHRPGEKRIETDRCQCRFPAENVGRAVAGNEESVTLCRIVPFDRRRNAHAGIGSWKQICHGESLFPDDGNSYHCFFLLLVPKAVKVFGNRSGRSGGQRHERCPEGWEPARRGAGRQIYLSRLRPRPREKRPGIALPADLGRFLRLLDNAQLDRLMKAVADEVRRRGRNAPERASVAGRLARHIPAKKAWAKLVTIGTGQR